MIVTAEVETAGRVPGPRSPMAVQTVLYGLWPARYLARCQRRHGDTFTLRLPQPLGTLVVLADPGAIRDAFALKADACRTDPTLLEPFLGAESLLGLDGERHQRQRRLLSRAFHAETMQAYAAVIEAATLADIDTWPVGRPFALNPRLQAITLEVILRVVFGVDDVDRLSEFRQQLGRFLVCAGSLLVLNPGFRRDLGGRSPWARFSRRRAQVLESLSSEIERRRTAGDLDQRRDMLSLLLRAQDEDADQLGDHELQDNLLTMVLAGHDTTATALAWAFDLVLHHPTVLKRLTAELTSHDSAYLDAVIKETLRLRPVIPDIGRTLIRPTRLGTTTLAAGTAVTPSILLAHRRPDAYPQPDQFRPERFLGDGAPDLLTWLPFGGGFRRCLGAGFATLEMQVVLRTVLANCRLAPADARQERQKRRAVTLQPRRGTRVILEERTPRTTA
ncbi:MAG: cytochrome P450 [Acidimicrobiales bacterium]